MKHPLRVDFAGGWLDVPRLAVPGGYVVNMAVSPLVHLAKDRMVTDRGTVLPAGSGMGTSAARAMLESGHPAVAGDFRGGGWQDWAVIKETGICCWASGSKPDLVLWDDGQWLKGLLAIHWTGKPHDTAGLLDIPRNYPVIANASVMAFKAVERQSVVSLGEAMDMTYELQLDEGMDELPVFGLAAKYCGSGHGGYAVYLFESEAMRDRAVRERCMKPVEPFAEARRI